MRDNPGHLNEDRLVWELMHGRFRMTHEDARRAARETIGQARAERRDRDRRAAMYDPD